MNIQSLCVAIVLAGVWAAADGAEPSRRPRAGRKTPAAEQQKPAPLPKGGVEITAAEAGKTISLPEGAVLRIRMAGNATTGYQWQVGKIQGDAIQALGKPEYVPNKNPGGMMGVGGTYYLDFKGIKPGKATVGLVHVRPWEKDVPPVDTFEATVEVGKK